MIQLYEFDFHEGHWSKYPENHNHGDTSIVIGVNFFKQEMRTYIFGTFD